MNSAAELPKQILEKVDELANVFHKHQETSDNYYEKLNRLTDKAANLTEDIGHLKHKNEEQIKAIKDMEVQLSNVSSGASIKKTNNGTALDYHRSLDKVLRTNFNKCQIDPHLVKEFQEWALNDAQVTPAYADQITRDKVNKAVIEGSNPQGGYWIRPQYSPEDVTREFETSPMREICNVMTCNSNILRWIIDDNLSQSGGWVGEVDERDDTETARIGELDIPIHEQFARPIVSHWMLDDATFDLVGWVNGKSRQIMDLFENSAFLTGDGSKKPRGILNYGIAGGTPVIIDDGSIYDRGTLSYIYSGLDGGFTIDGLVNIQNSLLEGYQNNAVWLTTRLGFAAIMNLKDGEGRPLYNIIDFLRTGGERQLLGKPVRIASPANAPGAGGMPVPASGAAALIYGDFRQGYTIVDRVGFMTIVDMITQMQYVKYYVRKRVGGALTSYQSLKVMQLSAPPVPSNFKKESK